MMCMIENTNRALYIKTCIILISQLWTRKGQNIKRKNRRSRIIFLEREDRTASFNHLHYLSKRSKSNIIQEPRFHYDSFDCSVWGEKKPQVRYSSPELKVGAIDRPHCSGISHSKNPEKKISMNHEHNMKQKGNVIVKVCGISFHLPKLIEIKNPSFG